MSRNTLGVLIGVPACALVAWQVGGTVGAGIFGGYLLGATVGGLSLAWQHHVLRYRPAKVMGAFLSVFFVKMALLFACWAVLVLVPGVAERLDARAFLAAYAVAILVAILLGVFDLTKVLKQSHARPAADPDAAGSQGVAPR